MTISLVEVAGANFRTDEESDKLNTAFMGRLGMRKRYLPARLAIARSLAMAAPPEPLGDEQEPGKVIKGDTLFGTGTALSGWVALIVQRAGDHDVDVRKLVSLVGSHWCRGLAQLDRDWEHAGQDVAKFVKRLVEVAELPVAGGALRPAGGTLAGATFSSGEIQVPIGEISEDVATKEKVLWNVNGKGGSPHSAIMGGSGSGKTVTAAAMLRAIRAQAPVPLLAFDFKGDLAGFTGTRKDQAALGDAFEAEVIEPPRMPVPLDVLALRASDDFGVAEVASRFRESFSRLKGSRLGDRQRTLLHEAATRALANEARCELHHIRDALRDVYGEQNMPGDGAVSTMKEVCRFPLFQPRLNPAEFFQKSWIIKLPPNVDEDSRTIVVNLVLDALDQYLNSLVDSESSADGARGLRILCMVDEAHQILGTKLPSLSRLIRMSRSKGGAIMLVSQSPDDFSGEDDDFLDQMGLVAAFSTNAQPASAARILGRGVNLTALQTGQAFVRRRGDLAAKRVRAW